MREISYVSQAGPAIRLTPTLWEGVLENVRSGGDVLFILLGGIMVLAMHSGFAFLELGTVRWKR